MKTNEKGYSLLVLIVAVIVILIITSGVITTINISEEERNITNFIYDINTIEETAKQYYSNTGMIPSMGQILIPTALTSQLDENDGEVYYQLDITKLNLVNIHDVDTTYVINADSLKVYRLEGVTYKGVTYYTVTDALMGNTEKFYRQDLDVTYTVSPTTWTKKANVKITIPNKTTSFDDWTFKWNIGPKDVSFFETGGTSFSYDSNISVNTNGVYSIYIKDETGKETVKNIVIRNIDDIYPKYQIKNNNFLIMDDETGIKEIRYKTRDNYETNKAKFASEAGRTSLDYYLLDGKGDTLEELKDDILIYTQKNQDFIEQKESLMRQFENLGDAEKEAERENYEQSLQRITSQIQELKDTYAHILDDNILYVLYVEDYAGNASIIVEDILTFLKVRETFNINMP